MTVQILHQVARAPHSLPPHELESQRLLQQHNPDWGYQIHGDDELLALARTHHPRLADAWPDLKGIQRADLGRYLALLVHGGVYADTDLYVSAPFVEFGLEPDTVYLAPSLPVLPGMKPGYTNYIMSSPRPGHPFFRDLLDTGLDRIAARSSATDKRRVSYVSDTTGRNMVMSVAKRYPGDVAPFPRTTDLGCPHTDASGAAAVHTGMLTAGKDGSWIDKARVGMVRAECNTRAYLGVRGNLCQGPFVLGCILLGLVVVGLALGLGLGLGLRRRRYLLTTAGYRAGAPYRASAARSTSDLRRWASGDGVSWSPR